MFFVALTSIALRFTGRLFTKRWFLNAEVKSTIAYANVKVISGHADVYNVAFHFILGLGGNFVLKE